MPDVLADLRAAFPVAELWVYFNHAAVSPVPTPVVNAVAEFMTEASRNGSTGFAGWLARRERGRARAAALLAADPAEVAFTTSTSQGLLMVAEGLRLQPGDQIVVVEDDFPANQIPWFRQRRRGAEVVTVRRRDGRVSVDALLGAISPRTRVLAVPWVLYDTGFRLDLPALGAGLARINAERGASDDSAGGVSGAAPDGRPARDRPVLLCVDAIQGVGAFPLDVHNCGIDFLSADSHKWMLGLEGMGLFYCRRDRIAELDGPLVSWWSMAQPFAKWTPEAPLHADARRFEYACLPTACLYGLDAALGLLLEARPERLGTRILELTGQLAAGLTARGWSLHTPMGDSDPVRGERSGILSASHPSLPAEAVVAHLERRRVSVTARGPGVRFSPHGWNTAGEVERLLEALP